MMSLELEAIKEDLEKLRKAKVPPKVFGADEHNYVLNEPIPEGDLTKFEAIHAIKTGERVTFYRWYRDWLDDALRKLKALENKL